MLSGDQSRALSAQLAQLDQAIKEADAQTSATGVANQYDLGLKNNALGQASLAQAQDQFLRELALRQWMAQDNSQFNWANL